MTTDENRYYCGICNQMLNENDTPKVTLKHTFLACEDCYKEDIIETTVKTAKKVVAAMNKDK